MTTEETIRVLEQRDRQVQSFPTKQWRMFRRWADNLHFAAGYGRFGVQCARVGGEFTVLWRIAIQAPRFWRTLTLRIDRGVIHTTEPTSIREQESV